MIKLSSSFSMFLFFLFVYFYFLINAKFIKRKKRRNTIDLPEDLLVEILSRVPEASLARFRCTSRGWNILIKKDGRLAKKSMDIMLVDSRVFYLASFDFHGIDETIVKLPTKFILKDPLSNSLNKVDISNVFHCDGLLLCATEDDRLVVWNPCSGETRWVFKPKDSKKNFGFYALGKSSCNEYKILRVDQRGPNLGSACLVEIYDFSSNSWRGVGKSTISWSIIGLKGRGMSENGNTFWLAITSEFSRETGPRSKEFLQSFDFSTERFVSVSFPVDLISCDHPMAVSVTREEQKLCLLAAGRSVYDGFDIDVWMATKIESDGAASWSKFLTVERDIYRQFFIFCNGMNFLVDQENKVLVCPGKHGNSNKFLHIVGEDKCIQVDHHAAGSKCSLLVSYVPTWVQIQQGSLG